MRRALHAVALVAATAALAQSDMGTDQQREQGKQLYDKFCSQCHGVTGDGKGIAWQRVNPAPRDFTSGKYKFRTTPTGMLPTDDDLHRVIKQGLPYTSMPAWPNLDDSQIQNIIYHLKTFSPDFQNPDKHAEPIDIPKPPKMTEESVAKGREVYVAQGCAACHGDQGRGNGASAKTLTDDWGHHLRPADMTQRWKFRGGASREDIFRTFSTGVNGTPMPSFGETLAVEDRWDLVNYIYSLGESDTPDYDTLVEVVAVEDELDLANPELWAAAPKARFPLLGQITQPGRSFYPWVSSVDVQAVYNRREIAVRVRWHDFSPETSGSNSPTMVVPPEEDAQAPQAGEAGGGEEDPFADPFAAAPEEPAASAEADPFADLSGEEAPAAAGGGEFSDAVAIQLPSTLPSGNRKPYFIFGDAQNPVDLYFVDLANPQPQVFTARGSAADQIVPSEATDLEVAQSYDDGEWNVVFKRKLKGGGGVEFQPGQFVPVAFSVWDGFNRERGNKRALSQWLYFYVRPAEVVSPVGPMVKAAGIALLLELGLVWLIRKRYAGPARDKVVRPIPAGGEAG